MTTPWVDRFRDESDSMDQAAEMLGDATTIRPIDPDGPPTPCSTAGCREDAVMAAGAHGLAACQQHIPTMVLVMNQATSGTVSGRDRPNRKNRKN